MPLGFANSIFSKAPAVAGASGLTAVQVSDYVYTGSLNYYDESTVGHTDSDGRQITLSVWFRDDNTAPYTGTEHVFFRARDASGNAYLAFQYTRGAARMLSRSPTNSTFDLDIRFGVDGGGGGYGSGTYDDGNWHHVMLSGDGTSSTFKLYVDGTELTSGSQSATTYNAARLDYSQDWWNGDHYNRFYLLAESTGAGQCGLEVAQLYVDNAHNDLSSSSVRAKFYDSGAVDMGSDGTSSGLAQPLMFHAGDSSTFTTNGGTGGFSYTLSTNDPGTATTLNDIAAEDGPQFSQER